MLEGDKMSEKKLSADVFDYKKIIEYQSGAVVSRAIVDKVSGTVTVFAFDAGQKLSTHSAPFDALLQVTDGMGRICIGTKEYKLKTNEAIIMPAGEPHSVHADEKFKMVLTMIKEK